MEREFYQQMFDNGYREYAKWEASGGHARGVAFFHPNGTIRVRGHLDFMIKMARGLLAVHLNESLPHCQKSRQD